MIMTDQEILSSWNAAADKKKHVQILADRNGCGVWEMTQKLQELKAKGLDGRWYQNLNPSRQAGTSAAKKTETEESTLSMSNKEYMKKVISVQDKTIREKDVEIAELRKQMNNYRKDAEDAAAAYESQISALQKQLADVEEICTRQQLRLDELEKFPVKEKPVPDILTQICFFCDGLTGSAAYIMGRIVELLLEWRKTGSGEALRDFLEQFMEEKE